MTPDQMITYLQGIADSEVASSSTASNTALNLASAAILPSQFHPPSIDTSSIDTLAVPNFTIDYTAAMQALRDALAQVQDVSAYLLQEVQDIAGDNVKIDSKIDAIPISSGEFDPANILARFEADRDRFLAAANVWFTSYVDAYSPVSSVAIAAANTQLTNFINGTGLPPEILTAIWQRTRDQATIESLTQEDQIWNDFAARGYNAPSGVINARLQATRFQRYAQIAGGSRDVAIKQAEIVIDTMKFGIQQALTIRQQFMNSAIEYLKGYLGTFGSFYSQIYTQPLATKVEYILGLERVLSGNRDVQTRALTAYGDFETKIAQLQTLPYDLEAKLLDVQTRAASLQVELERAKIQIIDAKIRAQSATADYWGKIDTTLLDGYYRLQSTGVSAAASGASDFARIASSALAGLNGVASTAQITF